MSELKSNLIKASREFLKDFSWVRKVDEPEKLDDIKKFKHALMHLAIDTGLIWEITHIAEHQSWSGLDSARINVALGRIFASCFVASKYSPLGNSDQMLQYASNFLTKEA